MKNDYEVNGDIVTIYLQEKDGVRLSTIIELRDFDKADSFPNRWYLSHNYVTGAQMVNKKVKVYLLHRVIMGNPEGREVDHKSHDTLDNRSSKLRVLTTSENMQNMSGNYSTNTSGYRGVNWEEDRQKWRVRLKVNGKRVTVGRYDTREVAIKYAKDYVRKHMPYSQEALAN